MTSTSVASPASGTAAENTPARVEDPARAAVVRACLVGGHHAIYGAPGSGRSTTAVELLAAFVEAAGSSSAEDVLLLAPTRVAAARLRDAVARRLPRTMGGVVVRTPASFAFGLLRQRAAVLGDPPPMLLTGADQDAALAELLAGHAAGLGRDPQWPAEVPREALGTATFRHELRDVLMRAAEAGWDGDDLMALGERLGRPAWVSCGRVLREYDDVTRLGEVTPDRGVRFDAAGIIDEAAAALAAWDSELPGHSMPRWRAVIHDDYQDATLATARLLGVLAGGGAQIITLGDPDVSVQTFRGADPSLLNRTAELGATRHLLPTVWRGDQRLRDVVVAATQGLPALGEAERRRAPAAVADAGSTVATAVVATAGEEARLVAYELRQHRLAGDVAWGQMAVLARTSGQLVALRRGLRAVGVPVASSRETPLAAEPALRPLLTVLDVVTRPDAAAGPSPAEVAELLLSPLGGLDAVGLRSLRRALRAVEAGSGGARSSEELLVAAVLAPSDALAALAVPGPARRAVARIGDMLRAAGAQAETGDLESILWAAWEASGCADAWRRRALGSGAAAERADADLDAVLALFRAAEGFTERRTGQGPRQFLELLQSQEFAPDTLAQRAERDAVEVLTAAAAAGREWDVVVVSGVQEDVWPDLRLRARLLDPVALSELAAGRGAEPPRPVDARRAVLWDERRLFASALSRARRHLLVTAVRSSDTQPSAFLDLVDPREVSSEEPRPVVTAPATLDLRGLVARLRAEVFEHVRLAASDDEGAAVGRDRVRAAASLLAALAEAGVPGADPAQWWGRATSSEAPAWAASERVPVRPSALVTLGKCSLRWALEQAGGEAGSSFRAEVGTLVHEIAADLPEGTLAELSAELERRWDELGVPDTWSGRRGRADAERMIELLAGYVSGIAPGSVATEVEFSVAIGRADLGGRVDRVEQTGQGVRIVDLKTGKTAIPVPEAAEHPQLLAYQAAAAAGAFGVDAAPDGARLVYVGPGRANATLREQAAPTDGAPGEFVQAAAETMAAASFLATRGQHCAMCPVKTSCPAQPIGARVVGR